MRVLSLSLLFAILLVPLAGLAEDQPHSTEKEMPPIGPPPQMAELKFLEGTWDVAMQSKWSPSDTVWIPSTGVAEYSFMAGGAALAMQYKGLMMGMPFHGLMLNCYDRETEMWQSTWTDDVAGRITMYTGTEKDGKIVMQGDEMYQGQLMTTRITSEKITEDSFDWMMEMSMDGGKTFTTVSTAKYTKRK